MHTLQIDASPSQIRRLHKGHSVRVKQGTGFELLVHPQTYNIVSHAFNKGKGSQIQLSPEEIQMNKRPSPEYHNPPSPPVSGQGLKEMLSHVKLTDNLNKNLGTNYGYLQRAGLDNAMAGVKSATMNKMGIDARYLNAPRISGMGAYGLHEPPSRLVGGQLEKGTIGRNGGMISTYTPPALVSQPFSANFQFQHFLPPQYQHFNSSGSGFH